MRPWHKWGDNINLAFRKYGVRVEFIKVAHDSPVVGFCTDGEEPLDYCNREQL
jgi:hypothetical protein